MAYLTRETFLQRVEQSGSKYWQEGKNYRWQYMEYVISILKEICPDDSRLIEAGTSGMPLSDVSTLYEYPERDLNIVPYMTCIEDEPETAVRIPNYCYDAFVALQVWEHLDNQSAAFQEVMRIAKSAVLSFPYKWPAGKGHDARHVGIDGKKIEKWTCGVVPEQIRIINHRAIYHWRFE